MPSLDGLETPNIQKLLQKNFNTFYKHLKVKRL
jgi:hypothetical protein